MQTMLAKAVLEPDSLPHTGTSVSVVFRADRWRLIRETQIVSSSRGGSHLQRGEIAVNLSVLLLQLKTSLPTELQHLSTLFECGIG